MKALHNQNKHNKTCSGLHLIRNNIYLAFTRPGTYNYIDLPSYIRGSNKPRCFTIAVRL